MRVCLLTELQAREFEHRGTVPDCRNVNPIRRQHGLEACAHEGSHLHMSYREAERKVGNDQGDGIARWVGGRFMISINTKRGWNSVRSGGKSVMQMTRETSGFRHASGGNHEIGAVGARQRRTTVRQTNEMPSGMPITPHTDPDAARLG